MTMTIDLQRIKARLEQKQAELRMNIKEWNEEEDVFTREWQYGAEPQDSGDTSIRTSTLELERTVLTGKMLQLAAVQEALKRIGEGTYGLCRICGQPIAERRLEVLPWADLCIKDQARHEQTQYHFASP
jgi:DnaK suppressor protein